jgi:hypothetical protein
MDAQPNEDRQPGAVTGGDRNFSGGGVFVFRAGPDEASGQAAADRALEAEKRTENERRSLEPTAFYAPKATSTRTRRNEMGGILLWLIGIPIPLIILLYFIF